MRENTGYGKDVYAGDEYEHTQQCMEALIRKQFHIEEKDIRSFSPLALAYIGDGIYELIIRTVIVTKGNRQVKKLHREASYLTKAQAQSAMMKILRPLLTEEEADLYRRGRNAKSFTVSKHASVNDYRRATGFEALMGYLYLTGDTDRLLYLVKEAVSGYTPNEHAGTEARNMYE